VRSYFISADVLGNLRFHQLVRHQTDALTQEINVLFELGLAQQLEKRHPQVLGHRYGYLPFEIWTIPMGTAGGRPRQRPMSIPHTPVDSTRTHYHYSLLPPEVCLLIQAGPGKDGGSGRWRTKRSVRGVGSLKDACPFELNERRTPGVHVGACVKPQS
jgi:hypothetical protein